MRNDKKNIIVELTFKFSLNIISYSEELRQLNKFEMASQIFRSGTSIGQTLEKLKMLKVKKILFINSKFQQKKQMKLIIGLNCVKNQNSIQIPKKHVF